MTIATRPLRSNSCSTDGAAASALAAEVALARGASGGVGGALQGVVVCRPIAARRRAVGGAMASIVNVQTAPGDRSAMRRFAARAVLACSPRGRPANLCDYLGTFRCLEGTGSTVRGNEIEYLRA